MIFQVLSTKNEVSLLSSKLLAFINNFSEIAFVFQYKLYGSQALSVEIYRAFLILFFTQVSTIF
jgi:hypothetical protein